jgi:hypothetical protein
VRGRILELVQSAPPAEADSRNRWTSASSSSSSTTLMHRHSEIARAKAITAILQWLREHSG